MPSPTTRQSCIAMIRENWHNRHTPDGYARIKVALHALGRHPHAILRDAKRFA